MTAEQEPGRAAYREKVDQVLADLAANGADAIAERAQAIRAKLTGQLAQSIANARAAERNKLELELAEALGIDAGQAGEFGWPTLVSMVLGVRSIADQVLGTALPEVAPDRRRELLVSFGAADYWARVAETAERDGAQWRQILGVDDRGRPLAEPGAAPDQPGTERP